MRPYIKCYWLLSDDSGVENDFEKIIPDGSPELIIHLGTPFDERVDGRIRKQEMAFVYGQLFASIEIKPSRKPKVAGIKFHPFGMTAFTNIPQVDLSGKPNSIQDVFPGFIFNEFLDKMQSAQTEAALFRIIDQMMLALFSKAKKSPHHKTAGIPSAVSMIRSSNGNLRIEELTQSLNISRRVLERKFNRYVGIAPKQLARIFRLQFALQAGSKSDLLTHLALEAGYYDQAHFIREFSSIVNERPSDYFAVETDLTQKFLLK